MTESQYAYQRRRSTELLLADLDSFAHQQIDKGRQCYLVGLDIEGAFDNADIGKVLQKIRQYNIPEVLIRFLGNWMTARTFRLRLLAPQGQFFSKPYIQKKAYRRGA